MNKFFSNKTDYNPNVNYDTLDQHTYADSGENVFFTCPRCKKQFLASFMFEEDGEILCIDCCSNFDD